VGLSFNRSLKNGFIHPVGKKFKDCSSKDMEEEMWQQAKGDGTKMEGQYKKNYLSERR